MGYDGLERLTSFNRGELNTNNTALVGSPTLGQMWTLDSTGNWRATSVPSYCQRLRAMKFSTKLKS
jgi:hypothetical protein